VEGIVQGVGFRPFVYALASGLGLGGLVGNDAGGVFAEVEGTPTAIGEFLRLLERDPPPLARVDRVRTRAMEPTGSPGFSIVASEPNAPGAARRALVSADTATCSACLRELADPADRRFGYPFINCTSCGPRFTIVRDVPYDRARTTMARFTMCPACAAEYGDPGNRRFHAEPTCCPGCGPSLALISPAGSMLANPVPARAADHSGTGDSAGDDPSRVGRPADGDVIGAAAAMLREGHVLAIKGLGGYHLAVDAASEKAAAALRQRKHREDKPFAVMVADVTAARQLCEVNDAAAGVLSSGRRPIVLLPRRPGTPVAGAVAPGNRQLGIMLPYTPLHHLLLGAAAGPVVLTSGNVSDEPIAYRDDDAHRRLGAIADAFLTHDRAIHIRTDDSVARTFRGREMVLRRSRGYVPEPVTVATAFRRPVLACGAELKNTFCLAKENRAVISHHIGDLENAETLRSFTEGIEHFRRLFGIEAQVVAYDLHPDYLSTRYALDLPDVELEGVQHHHAHIASCLADNGADGPVIGVAFDGTGYGPDGTIWGGEFLVADLAGFRRAGHLATVPMPGGAAAVRQPWRMAAAYLDAAFPGGPGGPGWPGGPGAFDVIRRNEGRWGDVLTLARKAINAPATSSAGRLFDAVSALLGVRDTINYEGQAAIEMEQLADPAERGAYRAGIEPGEPFRIKGADLVRQAAEDLARGTERAVIAARFQQGIIRLIEDGCATIRDRHGLETVALSGGVFQNLTVLGRAVTRLEARGFRVLTHSRVPCNDGGISLGQAVVAAARDAQ
jgi:hydrogenase maturation protein HypF